MSPLSWPRRALGFVWRTLKAFQAHQGFLLAGAVAYYALLSLVPLVILIGIGVSHFVPHDQLLAAVQRYLEWLVPGQSKPLVDELAQFLQHPDIGWLLLVTMLFFSSLAFTVLEKAMSVIFHHRFAVRRRHFMVSALMPYLYILSLGVGSLIVAFAAGSLQAMGQRSVDVLGMEWSLDGVSGVLLYLLGLCGEVAVLTSLYMVMPVGRLRLSHALIGGATAALLWEITRHLLLWYFATLSQVSMVYGSLATAIVVLLSLELGATLLLLGAQVIAEYERRSWAPVPPVEAREEPANTKTQPLATSFSRGPAESSTDSTR